MSAFVRASHFRRGMAEPPLFSHQFTRLARPVS